MRCRVYKCKAHGEPFCPEHTARSAAGLCTHPKGCSRPIKNKTRALCAACTIWVIRHDNAYYRATSISATVKIKTAPTDWRERAACGEIGPEVFFDPKRYDEASAVCEACPVRGDCLRWAIETNQDFGLWGGVTASQRRRMGRRYRKTGELVNA